MAALREVKEGGRGKRDQCNSSLFFVSCRENRVGGMEDGILKRDERRREKKREETNSRSF